MLANAGRGRQRHAVQLFAAFCAGETGMPVRASWLHLPVVVQVAMYLDELLQIIAGALKVGGP